MANRQVPPKRSLSANCCAFFELGEASEKVTGAHNPLIPYFLARVGCVCVHFTGVLNKAYQCGFRAGISDHCPSPVLKDDLTWELPSNRHLIEIARQVDRNAIFADFFAKARDLDTMPA